MRFKNFSLALLTGYFNHLTKVTFAQQYYYEKNQDGYTTNMWKTNRQREQPKNEWKLMYLFKMWKHKQFDQTYSFALTKYIQINLE